MEDGRIVTRVSHGSTRQGYIISATKVANVPSYVAATTAGTAGSDVGHGFDAADPLAGIHVTVFDMYGGVFTHIVTHSDKPRGYQPVRPYLDMVLQALQTSMQDGSDSQGSREHGAASAWGGSGSVPHSSSMPSSPPPACLPLLAPHAPAPTYQFQFHPGFDSAALCPTLRLQVDRERHTRLLDVSMTRPSPSAASLQVWGVLNSLYDGWVAAMAGERQRSQVVSSLREQVMELQSVCDEAVASSLAVEKELRGKALALLNTKKEEIGRLQQEKADLERVVADLQMRVHGLEREVRSVEAAALVRPMRCAPDAKVVTSAGGEGGGHGGRAGHGNGDDVGGSTVHGACMHAAEEGGFDSSSSGSSGSIDGGDDAEDDNQLHWAGKDAGWCWTEWRGGAGASTTAAPPAMATARGGVAGAMPARGGPALGHALATTITTATPAKAGGRVGPTVSAEDAAAAKASSARVGEGDPGRLGVNPWVPPVADVTDMRFD